MSESIRTTRKKHMYDTTEFSIGLNGIKIRRTKPVLVKESSYTTKSGRKVKRRSHKRRTPRRKKNKFR